VPNSFVFRVPCRKLYSYYLITIFHRYYFNIRKGSFLLLFANIISSLLELVFLGSLSLLIQSLSSSRLNAVSTKFLNAKYISAVFDLPFSDFIIFFFLFLTLYSLKTFLTWYNNLLPARLGSLVAHDAYSAVLSGLPKHNYQISASNTFSIFFMTQIILYRLIRLFLVLSPSHFQVFLSYSFS
jgi:hypothetical protein